jgi:YtcA family
MFARVPALDILGSFFPVWTVCIAAAIVLTMAARWLFVLAKLERELGPRVIIYPSMVTLFACAIWLIGFR